MKLVKNIAIILLGIVLLCVAAAALIVMLAYYQEPEAIVPAIVFVISFLGAMYCFIDA